MCLVVVVVLALLALLALLEAWSRKAVPGGSSSASASLSRPGPGILINLWEAPGLLGAGASYWWKLALRNGRMLPRSE